jgi:hypothetical protein
MGWSEYTPEVVPFEVEKPHDHAEGFSHAVGSGRMCREREMTNARSGRVWCRIAER